jgi:hypothetical protein
MTDTFHERPTQISAHIYILIRAFFLNTYQSETRFEETFQRNTKHTSDVQCTISVSVGRVGRGVQDTQTKVRELFKIVTHAYIP